MEIKGLPVVREKIKTAFYVVFELRGPYWRRRILGYWGVITAK
jgi:hypothetical protein